MSVMPANDAYVGLQTLNPFKMFLQILGPGMCFKICFCFIAIALMMGIMFLAPFLNVVIPL